MIFEMQTPEKKLSNSKEYSPDSVLNISPLSKSHASNLSEKNKHLPINRVLDFSSEVIESNELIKTPLSSSYSLSKNSSQLKTEDNDFLIGEFSRSSLRKKFGSGFPSKGMKKHGFRSNVISESSPAVQDGRVRLKKNGEIKKNSKAVKNGDIQFGENGNIDIPESPLFQSKQIRTISKDASHIVSFEIMDQVFQSKNLSVNKVDAEKIVRSLNKDDNLYIKTCAGNLSGTYHMEGLGDRSLDREIIEKMKNGENLSTEASKRAKRQVSLILNSKDQLPMELIEAFRSLYSNLRDNNGNKICRTNAKISEVDVNSSRNTRNDATPRRSERIKNKKSNDAKATVEQEREDRKETGLKNNGTPDLRTTVGKQLASSNSSSSKPIPTSYTPPPPPPSTQTNTSRTITGLKNNGTPDLRTTVGKQLASNNSTIIRQLSYLSSQPSYSSPSLSYSYSSSYSGYSTGAFYSSSGSANGRELFTGSRGGTYYINSNGNKTYV